MESGQLISRSSRHLLPGSRDQQTAEQRDGWIPGTSPGMTLASRIRFQLSRKGSNCAPHVAPANTRGPTLAGEEVPPPSGADLTFATHPAALSRSECQIQSSTRNICLLVV